MYLTRVLFKGGYHMRKYGIQMALIYLYDFEKSGNNPDMYRKSKIPPS